MQLAAAVPGLHKWPAVAGSNRLINKKKYAMKESASDFETIPSFMDCLQHAH